MTQEPRHRSDAQAADELLTRARRLTEDLNMTTLGWQMPSDRLIEDFAAGEHGLHAREHELADVGPGGERLGTRRAFSLYVSEGAGEDARFALLIEPGRPGIWRLLVPDAGGGPRRR